MMNYFESKPISILIRDINGKKTTLSYANSAAVCQYIHEEIECIDEILMVAVGEQIIWTSLGADSAITVDDLTGFFG